MFRLIIRGIVSSVWHTVKYRWTFSPISTTGPIKYDWVWALTVQIGASALEGSSFNFQIQIQQKYSVMMEGEVYGRCDDIISRERTVTHSNCNGVFHLSFVGLEGSHADVLTIWSCNRCQGILNQRIFLNRITLHLTSFLTTVKDSKWNQTQSIC